MAIAPHRSPSRSSVSVALLLALSYAFLSHLRRAPPAALPIPALPVRQQDITTILRDELHARIHALAAVSAPAGNGAAGLNRPFLSAAGAAARALLVRYMADAQLDARIDGAGNVVGDLRCAHVPRRKVFAMGSHFDTVRGGGMWDGIYGVLAAVAVAKVMAGREGGACALPFDVRVVAFDDEEGNNQFGSTNFGAKAYAGVLDLGVDVRDFPQLAERYMAVFPSTRARSGLTRRAAIAERVRAAAAEADELLGFVEVHIEQGPVLERSGAAMGVVNAIAGQTRLKVAMRGLSGHAGTVPMLGRRDALAAAAEAVVVVEEVGRRWAARSLVATVGTLNVAPGSSNVIAGDTSFTVDIRAPEDALRQAAVEQVKKSIQMLADRRGVSAEISSTHEIGAVSMTPWLRDVLMGAVRAAGGDEEQAVLGMCGARGSENCSTSFERVSQTGDEAAVAEAEPWSSIKTTLTSGAGHDTQFMAKITDVAMLFVRCKGGVSHHPDEHVSLEDSHEGAKALLRVVDMVAVKVRAEQL